MTYEEFLNWCRYRNKWGSFNVNMRIDRAVARSSAYFGNALRGKPGLRVEDFSPHDAHVWEMEQEALLDNPELFLGKLKGLMGK